MWSLSCSESDCAGSDMTLLLDRHPRAGPALTLRAGSVVNAAAHLPTLNTAVRLRKAEPLVDARPVAKLPSVPRLTEPPLKRGDVEMVAALDRLLEQRVLVAVALD